MSVVEVFHEEKRLGMWVFLENVPEEVAGGGEDHLVTGILFPFADDCEI